MITVEQIKRDVIHFVAAFSNRIPSKVGLPQILADPPLSIDSTGLGFLALSLRGYIKNKNSSKTITTAEVRKKNLTVSDLIELVTLKVLNNE